MTPAEIGVELRRAREAAGRTQGWVARKARIATSTVCGIERGYPAGRTLRPAAWRVARLFGLDIDVSYALRPRKRGSA